MENREIANCLTEHAHQLETQGANLYRIRAYRRAGETILSLDQQASDIFKNHGRNGLRNLPGIGTHLSYIIEGLITTGEFHPFDDEENLQPARCACCN
jgi:DNA polymerase/3'-5' exonuclease PolX